ncbi:hypothetical protein EPO04_01485 [Patescibacteria group bacterium]|nr:MAG: hypothetical protein EPO04_01485 [Patescibacteria group bacterium]
MHSTPSGFTSFSTLGGTSSSVELWATMDDAVRFNVANGRTKLAKGAFNAAARYFSSRPDSHLFYRKLGSKPGLVQLNLAQISEHLDEAKTQVTAFGVARRQFVRDWCEYALAEMAYFPLSLEQLLDVCRRNQRLQITLEHALKAGSDEYEICRFYKRTLEAPPRVTIARLLPYLENYNIRWNELVDTVCLVLRQKGQLHPDFVWREQILKRPQNSVKLHMWGSVE